MVEKKEEVNVLVQKYLVTVDGQKRDVSIYKQEKNKFVINPSFWDDTCPNLLSVTGKET